MRVFARGRIIAVLTIACVLLLAARALPARASTGPSLTVHGFGTAVGGSASYTLIVANLGDSDAPGVTLSLNLPAGAALRQANSSQGSCSGTVCALGTVRPGLPAQI